VLALSSPPWPTPTLQRISTLVFAQKLNVRSLYVPVAIYFSSPSALSQRIADFTIGTENKDTGREELMTAVARLRKELVEATPYLPSYDQRQSELVNIRLNPVIFIQL
jgi:hypothetical protein